MRRARGFTLIELVVVIVLFGILAVMGTNMVNDTMNVAWYTTQNQSSASQGRYAMERMTREFREMSFSSSGTLEYDITSNLTNKTTITFLKEDGTTVTIARSAGNLNMTYNPGTTAVLTDQLDTSLTNPFVMAYLPLTGSTETADKGDVRFIQITLNLKNTKTGKSDTYRSRVFLRNAQASP